MGVSSDKAGTIPVDIVVKLFEAALAEHGDREAENRALLSDLELSETETARVADRVRQLRASSERWRRRGQELAALFSSARELAQVRDVNQLLERLVERAHDLVENGCHLPLRVRHEHPRAARADHPRHDRALVPRASGAPWNGARQHGGGEPQPSVDIELHRYDPGPSRGEHRRRGRRRGTRFPARGARAGYTRISPRSCSRAGTQPT